MTIRAENWRRVPIATAPLNTLFHRSVDALSSRSSASWAASSLLFMLRTIRERVPYRVAHLLRLLRRYRSGSVVGYWLPEHLGMDAVITKERVRYRMRQWPQGSQLLLFVEGLA